LARGAEFVLWEATSTCDVSGHRSHLSRDIVPRWGLLGLVVTAWVEGECPDQRSVFCQDPDVEVGHQDDDADAGVAAAEPEVVQPAVVAKGDDPGAVDLVVADAVVGRDGRTWRCGRRVGRAA
jgi:hypothetical protein